MIGWRLYYGDGSMFSHLDGTWAQAPEQGVQVLVTYQDPHFKVMHDGVDAYRLHPASPPKWGAWVAEAEFYAIQARAQHSTVEVG